MSAAPLVTVLIPARNEEADIERCLECVAAQTHPASRLEVIVVDGGSTDGTAASAQRAADRLGLAVSLIPNEAGTTPSNLNAGLAAARGDIICRVDARTRIQPSYVETCVDVLRDPRVAVVGGAQVARARDSSPRAVGIARALNNRLTMGGARYRRSSQSGPTDTVYLGAFRRAELIDAGGWDERFATNQDYELNRRLGARGQVWFHAGLRSGYVPRATHGELWHQYRRFGAWKVRYWLETDDAPQPRQVLLLAAPLAAIPLAVVLRPWAWLPAAAAGLAAVDVLGAPRERLGAAARVHAAIAVLLVSLGWTSGAWEALIRSALPASPQQLGDEAVGR